LSLIQLCPVDTPITSKRPINPDGHRLRDQSAGHQLARLIYVLTKSQPYVKKGRRLMGTFRRPGTGMFLIEVMRSAHSDPVPGECLQARIFHSF
jgi:hypothetical protein